MVDSFLHEYSTGGEAHLPLVDEGGAEDGRETLVQVSIIENDASILASQLWWRRGWRKERRWMRRRRGREGGREGGESKGTDEWVRKECKREGRKVYYICKDPSLRNIRNTIIAGIFRGGGVKFSWLRGEPRNFYP